MGTTAVRRVAVKQQDAGEAGQVVVDHLEELARQGARQMLVEALQEEVEAYLGREDSSTSPGDVPKGGGGARRDGWEVDNA